MIVDHISPLKKNDLVQVTTGRDKGKRGKLLRLQLDKGRAFVGKINLVKRHTKASQANPQGGIVEKESSFHLSNLMYYCSSCGKPVGLGHQASNGKKTRICRKCGKEAK